MFPSHVSPSLSRQPSFFPANILTSAKTASTLLGPSGRVYTQVKVLRLNTRTQRPHIYKAQSANNLFVYKYVFPPVFALSQELAV